MYLQKQLQKYKVMQLFWILITFKQLIMSRK